MTADAERLAGAIRAEQVRRLYFSGWPMLSTLFAAGALCGLFLYMRVLQPAVAAVWLGIMATHISVRPVLRHQPGCAAAHQNCHSHARHHASLCHDSPASYRRIAARPAPLCESPM